MNRNTWRRRLAKEIALLIDIADERNVDPIITAIITVMREALIRGEEVRIPGFGIFAHFTTIAHPHYAHLVRTKINQPQRHYIKFLPSTVLKRLVNDN